MLLETLCALTAKKHKFFSQYGLLNHRERYNEYRLLGGIRNQNQRVIFITPGYMLLIATQWVFVPWRAIATKA